jgi:hypothetical protein
MSPWDTTTHENRIYKATPEETPNAPPAYSLRRCCSQLLEVSVFLASQEGIQRPNFLHTLTVPGTRRLFADDFVYNSIWAARSGLAE